MTVVWMRAQQEVETEVFWQEEGGGTWQVVKGWARPIAETNLWVYTAEIEGLKPSGVYAFRVGKEGDLHRFRTLPSQLGQVRFGIGGDAFLRTRLFHKMNQTLVTQSVDFMVLGGDIAYTNGERWKTQKRQKQAERWKEFLEIWKADFVRGDGVMVPLVVAVGNHDVPRGRKERSEMMFFDVFPLKDKAYRVLDVGRFLSLFLLDTGHVSPIGGEQAEWLKEALSERDEVLFKLPIYHVAAYPSVYPFTGKTPREIRRFWCPLFEQFGVQVAFENHNHAYKRTRPIHGVTYLGDGSWGVPTRKVDASQPYLAKAASLNVCFIVTVNSQGCKIEPISIDGESVDKILLLQQGSLRLQ